MKPARCTTFQQSFRSLEFAYWKWGRVALVVAPWMTFNQADISGGSSFKHSWGTKFRRAESRCTAESEFFFATADLERASPKSARHSKWRMTSELEQCGWFLRGGGARRAPTRKLWSSLVTPAMSKRSRDHFMSLFPTCLPSPLWPCKSLYLVSRSPSPVLASFSSSPPATSPKAECEFWMSSFTMFIMRLSANAYESLMTFKIIKKRPSSPHKSIIICAAKKSSSNLICSIRGQEDEGISGVDNKAYFSAEKVMERCVLIRS